MVKHYGLTPSCQWPESSLTYCGHATKPFGHPGTTVTLEMMLTFFAPQTSRLIPTSYLEPSEVTIEALDNMRLGAAIAGRGALFRIHSTKPSGGTQLLFLEEE